MLYVLAYPAFEPTVAANVARFRALHEPERAVLVPPHITLVFGLTGIKPAEFVEFCTENTKNTVAVNVMFTKVEIDYDPFDRMYKLFLMIEDNHSTLSDLHRRLYLGPHRTQLHDAIPYRPHLTIATNAERGHIESLDAAEIGTFPIRGAIGSLEVVELVDGVLRRLKTLPLEP